MTFLPLWIYILMWIDRRIYLRKPKDYPVFLSIGTMKTHLDQVEDEAVNGHHSRLTTWALYRFADRLEKDIKKLEDLGIVGIGFIKE